MTTQTLLATIACALPALVATPRSAAETGFRSILISREISASTLCVIIPTGQVVRDDDGLSISTTGPIDESVFASVNDLGFVSEVFASQISSATAERIRGIGESGFTLEPGPAGGAVNDACFSFMTVRFDIDEPTTVALRASVTQGTSDGVFSSTEIELTSNAPGFDPVTLFIEDPGTASETLTTELPVGRYTLECAAFSQFDNFLPPETATQLNVWDIDLAALPAGSCAGDCDGSGAVDFNDLVAMLFAFGDPDAGVACDADASGSIDFNDLVAGLFLFGPCE